MSRAIMIQGTMSNAGKSLLAGGLCRIFAQDGYRVAPFKAQNMALNSFITADGLEMGRAQVMQAEAAGIAPDVRMNPILLKPTNDTGSQIIVNGEVTGNMDAREYFARKRDLLPVVRDAYESLCAEYDIIVIEGAGSPAEINLKDDDVFVNMGMAKIAKAPVLLVGDIDRGGVFAQLIGTVDLLDPDERAYVKGLVVNKFRGDKTILEPGIRMLEERAGIPVVGVAPYLHVDIDDEDSLTERFAARREGGLLDIAVVRLARISNFTDLAALERIPGVSLRYVTRANELGEPDMIVLPGTKNTMGDLRALRENGMEAAVKKSAARGCVVFGICGGFQMLGESLSDPSCVEEGGEMAGMGLLPVRTVFEGDKVRTLVEGEALSSGGALSELSGTPVGGYEIHMGRTELREEARPFLKLTEARSGATKEDGAQAGNVYGTYLHGVFDSDRFTDGLVRALAAKKGVDWQGGPVDTEHYKEEQYNKLAAGLREHLDMEQIYRILEAGM